MNFFQLSCFVTVARTLNFARAAEELNVTQPAITHQIHSLETELGVKLFRRTTRVVELTTDGFLFLDDARKLLEISDHAKARMTNSKHQDAQIFSIGGHSYETLLLLPDILRTMKAEYPDIHPRLQVIPVAMSSRILEEERVDAILGFQEALSTKFTGVYKELAKIPVFCVCPKDHPIAKQEQVHIIDLQQELLLLEDTFAGPANLSQLRSYLLYERSSSNFQICGSPEAAAILVRAGYGVAIHAGLPVPAGDSLVNVPLADLPRLSFGLYYKTLKGRPILKRFIELLREQLTG